MTAIREEIARKLTQQGASVSLKKSSPLAILLVFLSSASTVASADLVQGE